MVEFLESLNRLRYPVDQMEVLLADGTPDDSLRPALASVLAQMKMHTTVLYEKGLPVSDARNRAAEAARGTYLLFFDSDCLIPENHLNALDAALAAQDWDVFGGPDAAAPTFSPLQKAISYAMTSVYTTGGIRGNVRSTDRFYPRGFNMGFNAQVFKALHGYDESFKCGEDIELSIRAVEAGYRVGLIPEIPVMHKRRATLGQFHRQVTPLHLLHDIVKIERAALGQYRHVILLLQIGVPGLVYPGIFYLLPTEVGANSLPQVRLGRFIIR